MSDRDLLNMIDAADDEYIIEAAPGKPQKSRSVYIRMIAAAACVMLAASLGFASADLVKNSLKTVPAQLRDFTVYTNKVIDTANISDEYNVTFKDASELDFNAVGNTLVNDANAAQTNVVSTNRNYYSVDYNGTYEGATNVFNRYDSPSANALYNSENNALIYYSLNNRSLYTVDGELSQIEAIKAAETFNNANYVEQDLSPYNYSGTRRVNTATFNGYVIDYYRDFCGYKTDDTLTVNVNMDGEIVELNAVNMGVCDIIEQNVSAAALEGAERVLSGAAPDIDENSKRITVDSAGNCYLYASTPDGNDVYVKLNA